EGWIACLLALATTCSICGFLFRLFGRHSTRIGTNYRHQGSLASTVSIGWRARRAPARGSGKSTLQNHDCREDYRSRSRAMHHHCIRPARNKHGTSIQ
ncbi:hypothetical protein CMEL01_13808, partial [Colletotrichum melonis]